MIDEKISCELNRYLDSNWNAMVDDLATLVRIDSVEDLDHAAPGAPYGPGPKRALQAALDMWAGYGFESHDLEGHVGYADWVGESPKQIGIIGHMDVVPVGQGWTVEPFDVSERDGYLLGRGTSDDKGPMVMALHAARFWMQQGRRFPYTLRFIIGANEETGMRDLDYYQQRFEDPDLLFSPDDEFPVCYGEKGTIHGQVTSAPIEQGAIIDLQGGIAVNAVPGTARAVLACDARGLPEREGIDIRPSGEGVAVVHARGVQAHASTPEEGKSAIDLLVSYLIDANVCSSQEAAWLRLVHDITRATDGSGVGIEAHDSDFGALTLVGGVAAKQGNCFTQSIDIRFVTGCTPEGLLAKLQERADACGALVEASHVMPLFLMDKEGPLVQTLLSSYRDASGDMQEPFTIGGATYSRHFKAGVGFGADVHGQRRPAWVGGMHAADEGVSIASLQTAFKAYAIAIARLMELPL